MKTIIIAAAVTFAAAGTAQALPPAPAAPAATASVAAAATVPAAKQLCVLEEVTGSRIREKTCKTAAEWDALGVKYTIKR